MKTKREKIWLIMYFIIAKNLPLSLHLPLAKVLRVFFAKRILKSTGTNINIEKGAMFNGQVTLGDYSGIGVNCEMNGPVTIGDRVNMGPNVVVYTRNHSFNRTDIPMQQQGFGVIKPVTIGNDVWLGRSVIILPGVKIGNGCIVGAGSVVTKSCEPYTIIAGNPAKTIKNRISDKIGVIY